jgi:coenzyme F420 hydrogenase subunit beta
LERQIFGKERTRSNELLGVSSAFLKGYAKDPLVRQTSSSGGVTTALLIHLLEQGKIDGAIVTTMDCQRPWRVRPVLAKTKEAFIQGAKSKYVISPNNIILRDADAVDRLAVVGLPCHIYGIRKLQASGKAKELANKIVFTLAIFCGSNQSYKVTEHLIGEYTDIQLDDIDQFEYRGGKDSQDVRIVTRRQEEIIIPSDTRRELGRVMTHDRCRMCCDFTGELADVSLGDIFDPQRNRRVPKWNSMIVRTEKAREIVEEASTAGAIEVSALEEASFYDNRGFEGKKHGGVYYLEERRRHGWPVPDYHYEFTWRPKRKNWSGPK